MLSILWNITESSFYVRRSLSLRSLSFFVTALSFLSHFLLYVDKITFTKFSLSYSGCISSLFKWASVNIPHTLLFLLEPHLCSFNMLSLVSSLHFHISVHHPFVENVMWVYHWETRKQHNCMLRWIMDMQWSISDKFWKKYHDWLLFGMGICSVSADWRASRKSALCACSANTLQ